MRENVTHSNYKAITMTTIESIYKKIDEDLNKLLSVKYMNNDKYVRYLYHGYHHSSDEKEVELKSEFSSYVLIDIKNQSMIITKKFQDVINFLDLSDEKIKELCDDIKFLINEECMLNKILNLNNIKMDEYYWRKLLIFSSEILLSLK